MELQVHDLHKSFDGREVLHGISFSISSGKALGLLGRNGAGKSTTIRILMDVFKEMCIRDSNKPEECISSGLHSAIDETYRNFL